MIAEDVSTWPCVVILISSVITVLIIGKIARSSIDTGPVTDRVKVAIETLVSFGFSKKEATDKVKHAAKLEPDADLETLINKAIRL